MKSPREQARRQLKSELREIGCWPNQEEVEPFLAESAQEGVKEHIIAALDGLDAPELVVIERLVDALQR